jgi:hypothetical protein
MEKPKWAFNNVSYFNYIKQNNGNNIIIFSDFEHNWDLFQFMNDTNDYYFRLSDNYKSEYNFNIIYSTYSQKCKHLNINKMTFILTNIKQEQMLQSLPIEFNYLLNNNNSFLNFVKEKYDLELEKNILTFFPTYLFNDAITIINDSTKLIIDEEKIEINILKNLIRRNNINMSEVKSIAFFGASVTGQVFSYVNYLQKNIENINIIKQGYTGCHINQAIWLVDNIIKLKPDLCFLEWTTSSLKSKRDDLELYLDNVVTKLIKNNITPVFLYLYKDDIDEFTEIINIYEGIANYYNITSFHLYKIIKELFDNKKQILKDSCHTNYEGGNLYGIIIKKMLNYCNTNNNINNILCKNNKYDGIKIINIKKFVNNMEYELFNEVEYFKIVDELVIDKLNGVNTLIAINILYYKNNGYIEINDNKILVWDNNCYYKRYGYVNLNLPITESIITIKIFNEDFDKSSCKYETTFPNEKYLYISEIICI